jgi:hypothetical protein
MRFYRCILVPTVVALVSFCPAAEPETQGPRRLWDLSPVSATNPVLAAVKECDIEIPVSEFRAFVNSSPPPGSEGRPLTLEEKRRELEKLLDDNFWIWRGYAQKADQTPDIAAMLSVTQNDAMKALLIEQEGGSNAQTEEEFNQRSKELSRRAFDRADIHIAANAYELLKAAAKRLNEADRLAAKTAGTAGPAAGAMLADGLSQKERELPLATCKIGIVRVGDFLAVYTNRPVESRSNLEKREAVIDVLREILGEQLLLAEARERGLDKAEPVRQQVLSDRTGLVRIWALDEVTKRASAAMKEPGAEARLEDWYRAHRQTLYTIKDEKGNPRVLEFAAEKERIQNDYFNELLEGLRAKELQQLRQGRKIEIDEKLLAQLPLSWPAPETKPQMATTDVVWDADAREYVAKAGETNTNFVFTLTNVSPGDLVIKDIHSVHEFITVKAPPLPWTLRPGERGEFTLAVDLRNKSGVGHSSIEVESSKGNKTLTLKLTYPAAPAVVASDPGRSRAAPTPFVSRTSSAAAP